MLIMFNVVKVIIVFYLLNGLMFKISGINIDVILVVCIVWFW